MPNSEKITLGFMSSYRDKTTKILTREVLYGWAESKEAERAMANIELNNDPEQKNRLKRETLPVAIFAAQCTEGGARPTKATHPKSTGLCIHDFDHMEENVSDFYLRVVHPMREEISLVFAHISPRGEGMRLVTELAPGESIRQCQARIAEKIGLQADKSVHDITRLSFIPSRKYFLYANDAKLFDREIEMEKDVENEVVAEQPIEVEGVANHDGGSETPVTNQPANTENPIGQILTKELAKSMQYQGVPYSRIIEEILARFATGGKPKEGERNNDLYALVRELRTLTQFNFQSTYLLVAPYFDGLGDSEIRATVNSAINSTGGRTISPSLQAIIRDLKSENASQSNDFRLPQITVMPKIMRKLVNCYPQKQREAAVITLLSMLGVYSTRVRARYIDNSLHSTTFISHVVAEFGSGKGFMTDLKNKVLHRLEREDERTRERLEEMRMANMNAANKGEDMKRGPRFAPRFLGDDTTVVTLYKYLEALEGVHPIVYSEEIVQLIQNAKGQYGNLKGFYLKGFDNARMTHETASQDTPNYVIPEACINFCTSSTFKNTTKFFTLEDGMASRVAFSTFPTNLTDPIPVYQTLTKAVARQLDECISNLIAEGNGQKVEYKLPKVSKAIQEFINQANATYEDGGDEAYRKFANRSAVIGFRAGLLAYLLEGHKETKSVIEFAIQVANYVREVQYMLFGDTWNEESGNYDISTRTGANKTLLSELPDHFTRRDVSLIYMQQGRSSSGLRMAIKRWRDKGHIREDENGVFHKLKSLSEV